MRLEIVLLAAVVLVGCGKKPEAEAAPKSSPARQSVSIDAPSESAPAAAPPTTTQADRTESAPAATEAPPREALTPQQAEQQFKDGEKQERAYEERLRRNGKWLQALQKANANEQQRILAEIQAAHLSPAELAELEGIKSYYGVTVSFR